MSRPAVTEEGRKFLFGQTAATIQNLTAAAMSTTAIRLYDLGLDDHASVRIAGASASALLHKGLPFETVPWRFAERKSLLSGQGKVPVIVDVDRVRTILTIAEYLEDAYADRPSLFGPTGKALSRFVTDWVEAVLHPEIVRLIVTDIHAHLHENDLDYLRHGHERLG